MTDALSEIESAPSLHPSANNVGCQIGIDENEEENKSPKLVIF